MKRTRFGSRDRLSRDAAELQRLATGLSESGGKLEDAFWEARLAEVVDSLSRNGMGALGLSSAEIERLAARLEHHVEEAAGGSGCFHGSVTGVG